jgi:hypothetical protein
MPTELGSQATLAVLVSFALQWLKNSKYFPWITVETQQLNRLLSVLIAFVSGFGIYATWGQGTLSISGLTAANLFHAGTHAVQQLAFQHAAYRVLIAPPMPGAMQPAPPKETSPIT